MVTLLPSGLVASARPAGSVRLPAAQVRAGPNVRCLKRYLAREVFHPVGQLQSAPRSQGLS